MTHSALTFPRKLTRREAQVLDYILAVGDPRVEPLRRQRMSAVVTGMCGCGCASINLAVDRRRAEAADLCSQPLSAALTDEAIAKLPEPNEYFGLLLFLDEGWLSLLEIWWIQKPPTEFPPPSAFENPRVDCPD
jgi:hypothetical protein